MLKYGLGIFFTVFTGVAYANLDLPETAPRPTPRPDYCPDSELQTSAEELASLAESTELCDFPDAQTRQNCIAFLNDPDIPQDALEWTLRVFRRNLGSLRMDQCLRRPPDHYSNHDRNGNMVMRTENLRRGIQNQCQIMINDTREQWGNPNQFPYRRTYYYLNLCTGEKRTGYFNLGTGTFRNNYENVGGRRTTVLGAFLTSSQAFSYSGGGSSYSGIVRRLGRVPSVALFGLQNTNNRSAENYKYMHVSPYRSSWGCPSIAEEDYDIIDTLAENGPSLVVNYGPENRMEDPAECESEEAPEQAPQPAPRRQLDLDSPDTAVEDI